MYRIKSIKKYITICGNYCSTWSCGSCITIINIKFFTRCYRLRGRNINCCSICLTCNKSRRPIKIRSISRLAMIRSLRPSMNWLYVGRSSDMLAVSVVLIFSFLGKVFGKFREASPNFHLWIQVVSWSHRRGSCRWDCTVYNPIGNRLDSHNSLIIGSMGIFL